MGHRYVGDVLNPSVGYARVGQNTHIRALINYLGGHSSLEPLLNDSHALLRPLFGDRLDHRRRLDVHATGLRTRHGAREVVLVVRFDRQHERVDCVLLRLQTGPDGRGVVHLHPLVELPPSRDREEMVKCVEVLSLGGGRYRRDRLFVLDQPLLQPAYRLCLVCVRQAELVSLG